MRLLEVQLRAAIECGNKWDLALDAARSLLPFYNWLYPKVRQIVLGVYMPPQAYGWLMLRRLVPTGTQSEKAGCACRYGQTWVCI